MDNRNNSRVSNPVIASTKSEDARDRDRPTSPLRGVTTDLNVICVGDQFGVVAVDPKDKSLSPIICLCRLKMTFNLVGVAVFLVAAVIL